MLITFAELDGKVGVGMEVDGHTYLTTGFPQCKIQAMREIGKDAGDLLNPVTWDIAAAFNRFTKENWPEPKLHEIKNCDCEVCQQRKLLRSSF